MKRLLIALTVFASLAALPLMHMALAAPADKVLVCHIDTVDFTVDEATGEISVTSYTAHVIEVNGNAQSAHEGHGDVVVTGLTVGSDCTGTEGLDPVAKAQSELDEGDAG